MSFQSLSIIRKNNNGRLVVQVYRFQLLEKIIMDDLWSI